MSEIDKNNDSLSKIDKDLGIVLEKKKENLFKKFEDLERKVEELTNQIRNIILGK